MFSYFNLGREEDPAFTIKTMVIQAQWPGASVEEMTSQVTDRIEKKLEELDTLDYARAYDRRARPTIFVNLRTRRQGARRPGDLGPGPQHDRRHQGQFPAGRAGPFFNDQFGDVYGNIYAFTGRRLTQRQLRDYVEDAAPGS